MLTLLKHNPSFRRVFIAHATSRAGDAFNTVALVILVFDLTGSGIGVATTVAFEVAPIILLGPIAGLVADRYPRRNVMVLSDLVRAGPVGVLAIAHGHVELAYAVASGVSIGTLLFNPAASSLIPDLVPEHDLVEANSALWTVAVVAQIILAPLAGALIATAGVGAAFGLNAASYLVSAILLRSVHVASRPATARTGGWAAVGEGIRTVRESRLLRRLAVVQVLAALSAGATSGLLVVLANDWLDVGPSGFGILLACIGIGAALGPLTPRRLIRPGDKRSLFGPYALRASVDVTLASIDSPIVAGAALTTYGVATSTGMVAYNSTLQTVVPPDTRGRAFAFYDVLWNTARLISLGLGGLLADALSIRAVYFASAALLTIAAAVGLTVPLDDTPRIDAARAE